MSIKYRKGTCIKPRKPGHKYIIHALPTKKTWGGKFLNDLTDEYPEAKDAFCRLRERKLGTCEFIEIDDDITVVNMIVSQIPTPKNIPPIRYEALEKSLREVAEASLVSESSIHMNRLGCDKFHGAEWEKIEPILKILSEECGTKWYVYEN